MNKSSLLSIAALAMTLAALPVRAQDAEAEFAPVKAALQTCFTCHGERGASKVPQYPILAGQEYYYLYVQLKDFKSGLRKNDIMGPIVATLDNDQFKLLAKYFSMQPWPTISHAVDSATVPIAKAAIDSAGCTACHLGDFRGNSRVPRLAGQYPQYLSTEMLAFKNHTRNNAPDKAALLALYSEKEIEALADYLGSLSVYQDSKSGEIH
jgi:cytochrome c553